MPKLQAFREFKPSRDTVEYTVYTVDQLGRKERYDFELPAGLVMRRDILDESLVLEHITSSNWEYNKTRTEYYESQRPCNFLTWVYRQIHLTGGYEKLEGRERVLRFLNDPGWDDKPRWPRFLDNYFRDLEGMKQRYEKFLGVEAKARELGLSDEEAGIVRRKDMVWRQNHPSDEEVIE